MKIWKFEFPLEGLNETHIQILPNRKLSWNISFMILCTFWELLKSRRDVIWTRNVWKFSCFFRSKGNIREFFPKIYKDLFFGSERNYFSFFKTTAWSVLWKSYLKFLIDLSIFHVWQLRQPDFISPKRPCSVSPIGHPILFFATTFNCWWFTQRFYAWYIGVGGGAEFLTM